MKNRIAHAVLGLIAATLITLGALAVPAPAVALEASGETGSATDTDTSGYIVDWTECGTCVWSIDSKGTLVVKPADGAETGELPYRISWQLYKDSICSVRFEGTVKASGVVPSFHDMTRLKEIDLSGIDTTNITSFSCMFQNSSSLVSADLSGLSTSSVTGMSCLFEGCSSLVSVELSGLDVSNVSDMSYMFSGCTSLASLDLSRLEFSNAKDMSSMFYGCTNLRSLELPKVLSATVQNMSSMFYECLSLESLDFSDFNTSAVTSMFCLFSGCSSLVNLNLSNFDTASATNMSGMFQYCENLARVELGENFSFYGKCLSRMASLPGDWWRSSTDGKAYAPDKIPNNVIATYVRARSISAATVLLPDQVYTGSPLEPVPEVSFEGEALRQGEDFEVSFLNNVNVGSATAILSGKGAFAGSVRSYFKITAEDASRASVLVHDQVYTGLPIVPDVWVVIDETVLHPGVDYDYHLSFSDNVDAGVATVAVKFIGNYSGTANGSFKILPADASGANIEIIDQSWTGLALKPETKVVLGERALTAGADYDVVFTDNVDVGTAGVALSFKGNYKGAAEASFKISPASIFWCRISVDSQTYTGSPLEPEVRVELGGRALSRGADYSVTYRDNVGVGTATAIVTGVGNYAGSASVTFVIVAAPDPDPEPSPTPDPEPTPVPDPEPEPVAWTFRDVSSSVAHSDDINWLASAGVSTGWAESDGTRTFRPYWNVARADMAAFLYRLAGSPKYTAPSTSPFKDVDSSTPHYKEICWLAEKGISQGWSVSGGKEFRPYATVARCDMAAFLYRLAGSPSYTVSSKPFLDCNSKTPHYKEVCWLASTGVSAGWNVSGGKEFRSYNNVARADMAAFLHRMKDKGLV